MKPTTCENCPYWCKLEIDVDTALGECRKSVPVTRRWIRTAGDDWCGEHPDWPGTEPKVCGFATSNGPCGREVGHGGSCCGACEPSPAFPEGVELWPETKL